MAYKIKMSKSGSKRQILSTKDNIYISKSQAEELYKATRGKEFSGVFVYLDKDKD